MLKINHQGVSTPQIMTFSTSSYLLQLPNHPLYPNIDWGKVGGGYYAIVDPMDPNGILYLSDKEYKIQVRVSVSQDSQLSILARPGDSRTTSETTDKSTNTHSNQTAPQINEELGLVVRKDRLPAERPYAPSFIGWYISRLEKFRQETSSLVTPTGENLLTLVLHWGLDLNVRAGGQLEPQPALHRALEDLGKSLARILLTRGRTALILKMKNTLFFINRWLAGGTNDNPFLLGEPVGLSRGGLPRILPVYLRRALGSKNLRLIRVTQSLFRSYSALEGPHRDSDLVSVTGSCPPIHAERLEEFQLFCMDVFWPKIVQKYALRANKVSVLNPNFRPRPGESPFYPSRGGPNHAVGVLGGPLDALAWAARPRNYIREWFQHVSDDRSLALYDQVLSLTQEAQRASTGLEVKGTILRNWDFKTDLDVGKLAFLPEAAGKVRTIAMVDYWTQRAMKPVHVWMMDVLSVLPTDGTFNQEEALRSYVSETQGVSTHYSIDLKSATDMIPIELYRAVLLGAWPEETVELWMALLTDRWFRVPSSTKDHDPLVRKSLRGTLVEYNRGQPMGTLSSWASMALVHHALELFSAHKAGVDPASFTAYRVLGDDNVTGNCLVAASYRAICSELQIPISHAKTLEGKLFIFASQVYLGGENVSPMSLKEEMSVKTCSQRVEMALRAVSRGWIGDKPTTARFLRLLCRKRDYLRSVKEFARGKLGRVAQAALISAFGLSSKILSRMGVQESGLLPFLLSIENKVQVLARDENHLSPKNRALYKETEILVAIAMIRRIIGKLRDDLVLSYTASSNWKSWRKRMENQGPLPFTSIDRTAPLINLNGRDVGELSLPFPVDDRVPIRMCITWSRAIWPILYDYYSYWLDDPADSPRQKAILDRKAKLSSGVYTKKVKKRRVGSSPRRSLYLDAILARSPMYLHKTAEAIRIALEVLDELVKANPDGSGLTASPMDLVLEVLEHSAHLPRLPSMKDVKALIPDRSPKEVDGLRQWARQMKTFSEALIHLDLYRDFSVLDFPIGENDHSEALRTSSAGNLSKKRKSITPVL